MLRIIFTVLLCTILFLLSMTSVQARDATVRKSDNIAYGSNIIRLSPLTALDVGIGFGLSYEKILGKEQVIGIVLPAFLILENKEVYNTPVYPGYSETRFNLYAYFTPGIKIYPFGQRKVTYAIGPNLLLAYGGGNDWQSRTDSFITYLEDVKTTRIRLGMLINNYINFQITPRFNLGVEGGLGILYYDRETISGPMYYPGNGTYIHGFDITGQFSMTFGIRF